MLPLQLFLFYGTGTKCLPSNHPMAFDKVIPYLYTSLFFVWKSSLLLSTLLFFKEIGSLSKSQTQSLSYLIFSLRTMSSSSSKFEILKFDSSLIYLRDSVGHQVWKSIFPSQELFILQVLLKVKLTALLLSLASEALLPLISISTSPSLKSSQKEVISISSLKKCITGLLLGRTDF